MRGYVVSDCGALKFIYSEQHYVDSELEAAVAAINAGTDMECDCCGFGPVFPHLVEAVELGLVDESRIDQALTRVLTSRMALGALDPPSNSPYSNISISEVESAAHLSLAREAAVKTLVLLKNSHSLLPLASQSPVHLCVFGPNANCTTCLMGDYAPSPSFVVTILEGLYSAWLFTAVSYLFTRHSSTRANRLHNRLSGRLPRQRVQQPDWGYCWPRRDLRCERGGAGAHRVVRQCVCPADDSCSGGQNT